MKRLMPDGNHYDMTEEADLPWAGKTKFFRDGVTVSVFHAPDHRVFFRVGDQTIEVKAGHESTVTLNGR